MTDQNENEEKIIGHEPNEKELVAIARRMLGSMIDFLDENADITIKVNGIKYGVKVKENKEIEVSKK